MTGQKILIVDDEPFNVDYLTQELEGKDYELLSAENGKKALELAESERPDLILLDIMMPVMDGFEVLSRLRADAHLRDTPVIVISANNSLSSVVKGIELGADDYLPKPFEPVILHARVNSCLEKKHFRDLQALYLQGLERELDIGREIQQGFLPEELPSITGWNVSVLFRSAREVAGDFYDVIPLPGDRVVFLVGDVCGKGVGAALFMTLFRSLLRAACIGGLSCGEKDVSADPDERILINAVRFTNAYIAENHANANMFATAFMGILNTKNGNLAYINCGNEPALIKRSDNSVAELPPTGPVLGVIPGAQFSVAHSRLESGEILVMLTDGIPDAMNAENQPFGHERLIAAIVNSSDSADAVIEDVRRHVEEHIGSASQFDDISILVVQRE